MRTSQKNPQPFVLAELGMWFVKLRAAYYFGSHNYIQVTNDFMYTYNVPGDLLATVSSPGTLVLLILPGAHRWGQDDYY